MKNYIHMQILFNKNRYSYLLTNVLSLLIAIGLPNKSIAQCTSPPAVGVCNGGNGIASNGVNINSGQTFWYTGVGAFSNGVSINQGGTLRVCGNLSFSTMTFNGGNIIIEAGGTLTINGTGPLNMNGNSVISNRGTLIMNRSIVMQNSNNTIFNATSASVINMNGGSYILSINSSTSRFINNGTANINTLTIQSSANNSAICLGPSSCLNLTSLNNNTTNSINAPSGKAVLRYTGNALLNNNLANSVNVVVCQATGSTKTGPATFGSATVIPNCPSCGLALPVELLLFEGTQENEHVKLVWSTATEKDNDYFTIEKSMDGTKWSDIGKIQGAGSSTQTLHYAFLDNFPKKGIQYYRLRQTDYNGIFTLSAVISIKFEASANTILIYPNPNHSNHLNILGFDIDAHYTLELKNMTGELLYRINHSSNSAELPVIANGIYFLTIKSEDSFYQKTFKYIIQ